jgi:hypothetical protein
MTPHVSSVVSARACSSQNRMSISRYIWTAVVRCSCAACRLPVRRQSPAETEVAVGHQGTHAKLAGERQRLGQGPLLMGDEVREQIAHRPVTDGVRLKQQGWRNGLDKHGDGVPRRPEPREKLAPPDMFSSARHASEALTEAAPSNGQPGAATLFFLSMMPPA